MKCSVFSVSGMPSHDVLCIIKTEW